MKKNLTLIIMLCILFNSLTAAAGAASLDGNALAGFSEGSSGVLNLFSVNKYVVDEVNKVITAENPLSERFSSFPANEEKKSSAISTTDLILNLTSTKFLKYIDSKQKQKAESKTSFNVSAYSFLSNIVFKDYIPPGGPYFIILFLLMYMVLLSRSNLPRDAILYLVKIKNPTRS